MNSIAVISANYESSQVEINFTQTIHNTWSAFQNILSRNYKKPEKLIDHIYPKVFKVLRYIQSANICTAHDSAIWRSVKKLNYNSVICPTLKRDTKNT